MKKYFGTLSLFFLLSCASLHTPSPHFVPSIIKKNQFEGEAAMGLKSASVNFAYSPFSRVTIMGNVQALPFKNNNAHFQRNCEVALGTYGSASRLIYGINGGYGVGAYNWDYSQLNDTLHYVLHTHGNFQKLMLQVYVALTDNSSDPQWLTGISLKENFYWDQYASLRYTTRENENFSGMEKNMSFEPCVFVKRFFTKKFYFNAQAGLNVSYDHSMFWPAQYLFTRVGLGLKL